MANLPTGTVTFLYTDLEGSTALWERHPQAMRASVARHDTLLRAAFAAHHGHVFRTVGDGLCTAFASAADAVAAALAGQQALLAESWGVLGALPARMVLHTCLAERQAGDYVGPGLNRLGRLLAIGHGGQVLLSSAVEALARGALPPGATTRDLGEHRLRDLVQPERIYQFLHPDLPADFPPLRSLDAYRHNLPLQLTSFIGRERELVDVKARLDTTRLLTLTGAGGCGKTRLALQVAAEVVDAYPEGVWLVELAPLADPSLVTAAVAQVVGVQTEPNRPLLATLLDALQGRRLLLVLDNCEHLLDACATLAETLVRGCASLVVLATSRELLNVAGEVVWRVPSLGLPDPAHAAVVAEVGQSEAVQLFVDRARQVQPAFAVDPANVAALARVCVRLDGIPLAIELAATRVRGMTVEQVAARLDDRFRLLTGGRRTALPRQQTLRATIDWSYELLGDDERILLRRLAVFAGGWTLEAAEAVASGDDLADWQVLDVLTRLIDRSLVTTEGDGEARRSRLLETVRQYAGERLLEAGEADGVRARHADYFLSLAERAEPALYGPDLLLWLDRLEDELDNLRAALEWWSEHGEVERALRLVVAVSWAWHQRDQRAEGLDWLTRLLARSAGIDRLVRARGLYWAGYWTWQYGGHDEAPRLLAEAESLAIECGARWLQARVIMYLAIIATQRGDLHAARTGFMSTLDHAKETGDAYSTVLSLMPLGLMAASAGDLTTARRQVDEALALATATGDNWLLDYVLHRPGYVLERQGDLAGARASYAKGVAVARERRHRKAVYDILAPLGYLLLRLGDLAGARAHLAEGLALRRELGNRHDIAGGLVDLGWAAQSEGRFDEARTLYRESVGLWQALGGSGNLVRVLEGCAGLAARQERPRHALRLAGAADALARAIGWVPGMILPSIMLGPDRLARALAPAYAALTDDEAAAAWAEGQALTLTEALTEAVGDG